MSNTQSVCAFVAFGIQHAMRKASYYLWPAPLNIFPHYLTNGTIFEKKKLLSTKCVFRVFLKRLCGKFFILGITERDMIENVHWSSCEVPGIVRFN
jgi:hypothetical protein